MPAHGIQAIEIIFLLLLLFIVAFGALARRLAVPYPIVLVIGGLALSLIPGIPKIALNPDLVFFVILPPLLYSAAWLTSWREFSYNLVSIFLLAFGLVTFTIVGVTKAGQWFLPGFDWRVGLVLGAIVAPTDAIAATSIAKRLGLPRRMVDILEGESLLNDASALLALEFGIGMSATASIRIRVSGNARGYGCSNPCRLPRAIKDQLPQRSQRSRERRFSECFAWLWFLQVRHNARS